MLHCLVAPLKMYTTRYVLLSGWFVFWFLDFFGGRSAGNGGEVRTRNQKDHAFIKRRLVSWQSLKLLGF